MFSNCGIYNESTTLKLEILHLFSMINITVFLKIVQHKYTFFFQIIYLLIIPMIYYNINLFRCILKFRKFFNTEVYYKKGVF